MSVLSPNLFRVPIFLVAKTKNELISKMLRNNLINGTEYNYTIIKDGNKWSAWYNEDVQNLAIESLDIKKQREGTGK